MTMVARLMYEQAGQSMTEYVLLMGLLVTLAAIGLSIFSGSVLNLYNYISTGLMIL